MRFPQQQVADVAAGASVGGATWAWLGAANELAALGASVVAIVAGLVTCYHYYRRWRLGDYSASRQNRKRSTH